MAVNDDGHSLLFLLITIEFGVFEVGRKNAADWRARW